KLVAVGGNVKATGSVSADGGISGNGGSVIIASTSASAFLIGGPSSSGVQDFVSARGGSASGGGGSVSVLNRGAGGIELAANSNIYADAPMIGFGGSITLDASSGNFVFANSTLSANAGQFGTFSGGFIKVTANAIGAGTGNLVLNANAPQGIS